MRKAILSASTRPLNWANAKLQPKAKKLEKASDIATRGLLYMLQAFLQEQVAPGSNTLAPGGG